VLCAALQGLAVDSKLETMLQNRTQSMRQGVASTSGRLPQRTHRCACAAAAKDSDVPQQPQQPQKRSKLPEKGFFAEANTKGAVAVSEASSSCHS